MNVSFKLLITLMKGESMEHDNQNTLATIDMLYYLGLCCWDTAVDMLFWLGLCHNHEVLTIMANMRKRNTRNK